MGFPSYAASPTGEIIRIAPDKRKHRVSGRPLKWAISQSGYASVSLCRDGKAISCRVNRIVCEAFHGTPPSTRHHAAHNDGNRLNNAAANLRWASPTENEADKRVHGTARVGDRHWSKSMPERRARGEQHGRSKLTENDVRLIRTDARFHRLIAADFGVSPRVVWMIKQGITWRHVA